MIRQKVLSALIILGLLFSALPATPARAALSDCAGDSRYIGQVLPATTLGLIVRSDPVTGARLGKLAAGDCLQADETETGIDGRTWLHITAPQTGYVASWWTEYRSNVAPLPIEQKIAIPGPCYLLSDAELGISWDSRFPGAKLDAYPATINLRGGSGSVQLSPAWLTALRQIMTAAQWAETWKDEQGWHNKPHGEIGRVQQLTFAHSYLWVTGVNSDGLYEVASYYNNEQPPNLRAAYDKYRINVFSVMDKRGNIFYSDKGLLPVLVIANSRAERLRVYPRYCQMMHVPFAAHVHTPASRLNVRNAPGGEVLTTMIDQTPVTVFELQMAGGAMWGRITSPDSLPGWISMYYTDWGR